MRILAVLTLVAILIGAPAVIAAPAVDTNTQLALGSIDTGSGFDFQQCPDSQTLDQIGGEFDYNDVNAIETLACAWVYVNGMWYYRCV